VVSTAAVLRCGKQMEKNYINTFPGQSLSRSLGEAMDLSQDRLLLDLNIYNKCVLYQHGYLYESDLNLQGVLYFFVEEEN
jgi:hypothetical protein